MTKRQAEEPLEDAAVASPAPKKARVEDEIETTTTLNGRTSSKADRQNGNGTPSLTNEDDEIAREAGGDSPDSSDIEDDAPIVAAPTRQSAPTEGYSDLYLDTIKRAVLDFDFEKLCSVTLSNINVYACLVCGKYYQGRGPKSHAYFHALEVGHHVYVNMETQKVYVLPEGYEVKSKSLDDIKYVVDPTFAKDDVVKLDREVKEAWDLQGKKYRPGYIGMNNIKANDYLNVVVQVMAHVAPIRNFFLLHPFDKTTTPQLPLRFSTLVRKIWNAKAFKSHVSPHELLQEIALRSSKRFTLTQQSDPVEFLSWFLNNLHLSLGGSKKPSSPTPTSIIQSTFRGTLRIESQAITAVSDATNSRLTFSESSTTTSNTNPFMILTLDLPPTPLFASSNSESIIPQIPLTTLLAKYNGIQASEKLAHRVRHRLLHPLPPYLLFHIKRFSKNKFVSERNPTIVTFPSPRSLDMSPYVEPNPESYPPSEPIWYDLVANVILDPSTANPTEDTNDKSNSTNATSTTAGAGAANEKVNWLVQVRDKARALENEKAAREEGGSRGPEWLEIQDLWVKGTESETLFTREGYLMVWERRKGQAPKDRGGRK